MNPTGGATDPQRVACAALRVASARGTSPTGSGPGTPLRADGKGEAE